MCGICGAVGIDDADTLSQMATCQQHRGPNSTGTHQESGMMLANQRLSVIDIQGGDQPIYNEDGDVVVVYNGEIYNFDRLRTGLEAAGHTFATRTDTEVLVHGYEEWGTGVFERLNGMFAVALWDATRERVVLARDRAGIKPLYYAPIEEGYLFGSEPKSILRSGRVAPEVDRAALRYFLQLRYSPSHTTLFDGIETVLPGTYLVFDRTSEGEWDREQNRFWSLADTPTTPPDDPVSAVREALGRAVERQLVSDVPIGFYLSGGLDTSSVVAMADERTDEPIHTFCMGFADGAWDERDDAHAVADHFGTEHHEILIDGDFMRDFPRMIWQADEPKRNLYPYYVAREMADHVTVALGGLGADELFGGYVYRYDRLRELDDLRRNLPPETRTRLASNAGRVAETQVETGDLADDEVLESLQTLARLDDPIALYVLLNSSDVVGDDDFYRRRLFGEALAEGTAPREFVARRLRDPDAEVTTDLREIALDLDFSVKLPDDFLLVEDRMSMAHSLESRVPFLDNDLVDLAFSLPLSAKFGSDDADVTVGKTVLRRAMRDRLPEAVFRKDKQGFTMPTYRFAREELLPHARSILDDPHVVCEGFVEASYLDDLLGRTPSEALVPHYKLLWKVVALELWYQMYIVEGAAGPKELSSYYT